jgi:hypothetical protein
LISQSLQILAFLLLILCFICFQAEDDDIDSDNLIVVRLKHSLFSSCFQNLYFQACVVPSSRSVGTTEREIEVLYKKLGIERGEKVKRAHFRNAIASFPILLDYLRKTYPSHDLDDAMVRMVEILQKKKF